VKRHKDEDGAKGRDVEGDEDYSNLNNTVEKSRRLEELMEKGIFLHSINNTLEMLKSSFMRSI
jgi:hypothetical protein